MIDMDKTAEKVSGFIKAGHVPSRFLTPYDEHSRSVANCFEHAFLNLTDNQLHIFDKDDRQVFGDFLRPTIENCKNRIFRFIKKTGLQIEHGEKKILKSNEWQVALFFSKDLESWEWEKADYHFLLREKDGTWTSKYCSQGKVEVEPGLPKTIKRENGHTYELNEVVTISNPFAK